MGTESAGILMYKRAGGQLLVLLAHPGGPYWRNRDDGAWTIPKGAPEPGEPLEAAARRELAEELGAVAGAPLQPLGRVRQKSGKWVEAFACEGDFDTQVLRSNTFEIEWPPRSGRVAVFPEVDRAQWFTPDEARRKILPAQLPLLDALTTLLGSVVWSPLH